MGFGRPRRTLCRFSSRQIVVQRFAQQHVREPETARLLERFDDPRVDRRPEQAAHVALPKVRDRAERRAPELASECRRHL